MRLIDADELNNRLSKVYELSRTAKLTSLLGCVLFVVQNMPTADVAESIKPYAEGDGSFACNNCGETVGWEELNCGGISLVKYKYCPECGKAVKWDE